MKYVFSRDEKAVIEVKGFVKISRPVSPEGGRREDRHQFRQVAGRAEIFHAFLPQVQDDPACFLVLGRGRHRHKIAALPEAEKPVPVLGVLAEAGSGVLPVTRKNAEGFPRSSHVEDIKSQLAAAGPGVPAGPGLPEIEGQVNLGPAVHIIVECLPVVNPVLAFRPKASDFPGNLVAEFAHGTSARKGGQNGDKTKDSTEDQPAAPPNLHLLSPRLGSDSLS